jgi:hypothetical protein
MALPYIPNDIISEILSQADLPIDTYLSMRKHKEFCIVRRPLHIHNDIKKKLDTFMIRRTRKFQLRNHPTPDAWFALDEFQVFTDENDKVIDITIDDLNDGFGTRMSFKISQIDHVNREMWILNETCCYIDSGKLCDTWIDS